MRLLLDEHYPPRIAERLRSRGHDVVSAAERGELRALSDRELLARANDDRRVLVTEDVADFMPLVREAIASEESSYGIVFTSPKSLPRSRDMIGKYVTQLGRLCRRLPADDALAGQVHWLERS